MDTDIKDFQNRNGFTSTVIAKQIPPYQDLAASD